MHLKGKLLDFECKIQGLLRRNTNLKKLLVEDTVIGPLSLAEVLKSNQELNDLTLIVSTKDDDDHENQLSSSYPRPASVVTNIDPRLRKTPIQTLQDAARDRQPPLLLQIMNSNEPANGRMRSRTMTRSSSLTCIN